MGTISKIELARQLKVHPSYIGKICGQEKLTLVKVPGKKVKQIDLLGVDTLEFLRGREINNIEIENKPEPPPKKPGHGNNPSGISSNPDDTTKTELEKLKIKEQTEQIKIKNEMIRGALIEKKHVVKLFAKIHEIDQNQFKTLNIKVVPKISSVYNVANDTNTKAILKIIGREDDKDLKTEIVAMLNAGEEDRILENTKILEDATGEILAAVMRETDNFIRNMDE